MIPYRQPSTLTTYKEPTFVLAPEPSKEHVCNPPGFFKRLFLLIFKGIRCRPNSLWRCSFCTQIWQATTQYGYDQNPSFRWHQVEDKHWHKALDDGWERK